LNCAIPPTFDVTCVILDPVTSFAQPLQNIGLRIKRMFLQWSPSSASGWGTSGARARVGQGPCAIFLCIVPCEPALTRRARLRHKTDRNSILTTPHIGGFVCYDRVSTSKRGQ
jgi:hypothetical protein